MYYFIGSQEPLQAVSIEQCRKKLCKKKGIHFTDQELHDIRKLFYEPEFAEIDEEHYFRVQREKALAISDKQK
ncbi:hypothetical protein N8089_03775 [Flavobacteriales bacterium]|nr:hypothetical protein [Flavobacteriales bacterium]